MDLCIRVLTRTDYRDYGLEVQGCCTNKEKEKQKLNNKTSTYGIDFGRRRRRKGRKEKPDRTLTPGSSVSGCYNELLQMWWLKTSETYSLTILEERNPKLVLRG